jgi:uncharacterized membrane protein (UPF0182 family)
MMGVSYLGINISSGVYIVLLLAALIIFVSIWIAVEHTKQRKHHNRLKKLKKADLRLIN